ncbi:MAG: ArsA family ATPase, partial [Desulfomonilaceae bacterium]
KTTVAAATGLKCAQNGLKTIVISIDIAHSLSDSFELGINLHDRNRGKPRSIAQNLWIQEVDIQEELEQHWGEVSKYLAALLGSSGIAGVLAEELAVIPGMEDVISLLYINRYYREKSYDVIIVDCAPTGESLRFISMPSTLEWYMKRIFNIERSLFKIARPIAKKVTDIPIPEDSYFASVKDLFLKLEGVDNLLLDRKITSVRLVTNAEKMVDKETQRAFMYFCLYGLVVDAIIVNRLFPEFLNKGYFADRLISQKKSMEQIDQIFSPIPVLTAPMLKDEVIGTEKLGEVARLVYGQTDPATILHDDKVYTVNQVNDDYELKIKLPFITKEYVDLFKDEGDLIIRIGSFKRHVFLPRSLFLRKPSKANLEANILTVHFEKNDSSGEFK